MVKRVATRDGQTVRRRLEDRFAPLFMLANWTPPSPLETPKQRWALHTWLERQGGLRLSAKQRAAYYAWLEGGSDDRQRAVLAQVKDLDKKISEWVQAPEGRAARLTQEQREVFYDWLEGVRRAFDKAGFALPGWGQGFSRRQRLLGRWRQDPGDPYLFGSDERLLWFLRKIRDQLTEEPSRIPWKTDLEEGVIEHPGGALRILSDGNQRRRREVIRSLQARPMEAWFSTRDGRVTLGPNPRDLRACLQVLLAELASGPWPVRRCLASKCRRYVGQWTKHERLFCDAACRTDYHNARKATRRGREHQGTRRRKR